jgi:hypothetical protein
MIARSRAAAPAFEHARAAALAHAAQAPEFIAAFACVPLEFAYARKPLLVQWTGTRIKIESNGAMCTLPAVRAGEAR